MYKKNQLVSFVKSIFPAANKRLCKGDGGCLLIIGGSDMYTGAPFFSGKAALLTGAELCYIFCANEALIPLKILSPEFIVIPICKVTSEMKKFEFIFKRTGALLIGPGLSRDSLIQEHSFQILKHMVELDKPIVIDGDGFTTFETYYNHITNLQDTTTNFKNFILTPNQAEFSRLCNFLKINANENVYSELVKKIPKATLLIKGPDDIIINQSFKLSHNEKGSGKRASGTGDILSGIVSTLFTYLPTKDDNSKAAICYASSIILRSTASSVFKKKKFAMVAEDILDEIDIYLANYCFP